MEKMDINMDIADTDVITQVEDMLVSPIKQNENIVLETTPILKESTKRRRSASVSVQTRKKFEIEV